MFRRVKFVKLDKSKARIYYRIFIREILAITFIIDIESFLFLFNYTIERNNWSLKVGLFHFVKFVKLIKATIFITGYLSTEKLTCQRKKLHFYSLVRNGSWFPNNASPIRHGTLAASFIGFIGFIGGKYSLDSNLAFLGKRRGDLNARKSTKTTYNN